jgi:hypothetical protein
MEPHALPIVCLNHNTGSLGPLPWYIAGMDASSARRSAFQAGVRGIMTRRARTGRGIRERREGSVREYTSCHSKEGDRPSLTESVLKTSGLFSRSSQNQRCDVEKERTEDSEGLFAVNDFCIGSHCELSGRY